MTSASTNEDWFARMLEIEANAGISVGGLRAELRARQRDERRPEIAAVGKLIDLRRRAKGLAVQDLTKLAHVTEFALADLERGLVLPNTRDVICLAAKVLELPMDKLLTIAGMTDASDPISSRPP
jgi:hypothetical protein